MVGVWGRNKFALVKGGRMPVWLVYGGRNKFALVGGGRMPGMCALGRL
jgi:hypothetical protein